MPHILELFAGTGSVGRAFRAAGWEVTSVDMDPKAKADITCDIMDFVPPQGVHYDHCHASPPCTEFSRALTTRPRDLAAGLRVAERALAIIRELKPNTWTIENPGSGLLPQQASFKELPWKEVTYCRYGYRYRKLTWFGTNLGAFWEPREVCNSRNPCEHKVGNRHPESAQRGPSRLKDGSLVGGKHSQNELYSIPQELCNELAAAATMAHLHSTSFLRLKATAIQSAESLGENLRDLPGEPA